MIRPDFEKWGQIPEDMRQLAINAEHRRSRERYQALYMIGTKQTNATRWSKEIKRKDWTVMGWIHTYNEEGPEALLYKRTGGHSSFLVHKSQKK